MNKSNNFLDKIFEIDRRLRIEHKKVLSSPFINYDFVNLIDKYLSDFADYNNLSPENIVKRFNSFVSTYTIDIKNFISTGKYPHELNKHYLINRIDYEVSLILSTVVTVHRHRIMDKLTKLNSFINGKVLMIGLGSGLELELINIFCPNLDVEAYDIHVSEFVQNRFNNNKIIKGKFNGRSLYYNYIIAIELLEHLKKPYSLISLCYKSLKSEGIFITTTAKNIPQFDHMVNFDNENNFEKQISNIGFVRLEKEHITHDYMKKNINAKNTWYVLKKHK